MQNKPFLSIIIPCYNVAKYLPKTLESLNKMNKSEEAEFLFVNDGSTDNTLMLLEEFAADKNNVKVISQKNKGVSAARNNAISHVTGQWLTLLDGDDYLEQDTIDIIKKHCQDVDLIIPNTIYDNGDSSTEIPHAIQEGIYTINDFYSKIHIFPTAPKNIYRADIIKEHNVVFNEDIKVGEIYCFTVDYLQYCSKISLTNDRFYHYVLRGDSATHAINPAADITAIETIKHLCSVKTEWSQTSAYNTTALKMALSFTYNKYVKAGIKYKEIKQILEPLLMCSDFRTLLHQVAHDQGAPKQEQFLAKYISLMPISLGYNLLSIIKKVV